MIKPVTRKGGTVWQAYGRRNGSKQYLGSFESEAQAKEAIEDHRVTQRQIARGELPPELDRKRTLDESLDTWLAKLAKDKRRSKDTYEYRIARYVRPWFKSIPLVRVTPTMVGEFQTELLEGRRLDPSTVNGIVTTLSSAYGWFHRQRWVQDNPAKAVPLLEVTKRDFNWLRSYDEQEQLLAACRDPLRSIVATLLMTGMRLSECTYMHWVDVSLDLRIITVQRGKHGVPKSGKIRQIPINDGLLPVLRTWKLQTGTERLVFPGRAGKPRHPSSVRAPFKDALKAAGLDPALRVHDCRHTYAAHFIREGGSIYRLSKYLGHSSVTITESVYGHLDPSDFKADWGRNCLRMPGEPAKVIPLRETAGRQNG